VTETLRLASSTLIAAGLCVITVAAFHRHSHAAFTLDVYAHALLERDREAEGIFGSS